MNKISKTSNRESKSKIKTNLDIGIQGYSTVNFLPMTLNAEELSQQFQSLIDVNSNNTANINPTTLVTRWLTESRAEANFTTTSGLLTEIVVSACFDSYKEIWIAKCDELNLMEQADTIDLAISSIENILNEHKLVNNEYHLSIRIDKFNIKNKYLYERHLNIRYCDLHNYSDNANSIRFVDSSQPLGSIGAPALSAISWRHVPMFPVIENELSNQMQEYFNWIDNFNRLFEAKFNVTSQMTEFPIFDVKNLSRLAEEESYTMPKGLTREQKLEWAKEHQKRLRAMK
ncbi:hypothetical protein [Acinetobacter sp. AG3]|uniref:hypothetical protein n=1 Tax=unclassified Acinetobacter TaxID=196816 RepID=UPI001EF0F9F3|nr:hypothetical protein [Acinetobacter sp. AG3]MCG7221213.1 hypothetical protein [Acinetobacter sp. AG3]